VFGYGIHAQMMLATQAGRLNNAEMPTREPKSLSRLTVSQGRRAILFRSAVILTTSEAAMTAARVAAPLSRDFSRSLRDLFPLRSDCSLPLEMFRLLQCLGRFRPNSACERACDRSQSAGGAQWLCR
jgi:hypothetical protein